MSGNASTLLSSKGGDTVSTGSKVAVKSGFDHLDVNRLFKGKAVEPTAKQVTQKHGMQTLGKALPARRAGGPTVTFATGDITTDSQRTSEPETNTPVQHPPITTTTQSLQDPGWMNQQQHSHQHPPLIHHQNTIPPLLEKKWNGGRLDGSYPTSRFAQEFPTLDAAVGDGVKAPSSAGPLQGHRSQTIPKSQDNQYGPGPILRPQTEGSWTQGGSGGRRPSPPNQPANYPQDRGPMGCPVPPQMSLGGQIPPPLGAYQAASQFGRPTPLNMYQKPGGPGFYPGSGQNPGLRFGMPIPHDAPPPGPAGGPADGPPPMRRGPPSRPSSHFTSKPIIKQEELERMDEIGTHDGDWASTNDDVDYNKKISFSDEEDHSYQNKRSSPPPKVNAVEERDRQRTLEREEHDEKPRHDIRHSVRDLDSDWRPTRMHSKEMDRDVRRGRAEEDWRSGPSRSFGDDFRGKKIPPQRDTRPPSDFPTNKFPANVPPRFRQQQQNQNLNQNQLRQTPSPNANGTKDSSVPPTYTKILERKRGESESSRESKDIKEKRKYPDHQDARPMERDSKSDDFRKKEIRKEPEKRPMTSWADEVDEDESLNAISEIRKPHHKEPSPILKREERRDRIESKRMIKQTKVVDMPTPQKQESPLSKPPMIKETNEQQPPQSDVKITKPTSAWAEVDRNQVSQQQGREEEKEKAVTPQLQRKNSRESRHNRPGHDSTELSAEKLISDGKEVVLEKKDLSLQKVEKASVGPCHDERKEAKEPEKRNLPDHRGDYDQFYKRGTKCPPPRKNSRESKHAPQNVPPKQDSVSEQLREDGKSEATPKRTQTQNQTTKPHDTSSQHKEQKIAPTLDSRKEESERRDKRGTHQTKQQVKPSEAKQGPGKVEEAKAKPTPAANAADEGKRSDKAWGERKKGGMRQHEEEGLLKEHKADHKKMEGEEFRRGNKSPSTSKRNASSHQRGGSKLQGYGPPSDRSPFSANTNKDNDEKKEKDKKDSHAHPTRVAIPPPTSGPIPLMALGEISPPDLPMRSRHHDFGGRPPRFQRGEGNRERDGRFPSSRDRSHKQSSFRGKSNRKEGKGHEAESEHGQNNAWNKPLKPTEEESVGKPVELAKEHAKPPSPSLPAAQAVPAETIGDLSSSKVPTMVFENTKLKMSETQGMKTHTPRAADEFPCSAEKPVEHQGNKQIPLPFPKEPSPVKLDFGSSFGEERDSGKTAFLHQASRPYSHMTQRTMSPLQGDLPDNLQAIRSIWETPSIPTEPTLSQDSLNSGFGQDAYKESDSPVPSLGYRSNPKQADANGEKQQMEPYPLVSSIHRQSIGQGTNGYASVVPSSVSVIAKPNSSASPTGFRQQQQMKALQQQHSLDSQQQQQNHAPIFSPFGYGLQQGANSFGPIGGVPSPPIYGKNSSTLYQQFTHHENSHVLSSSRSHSQYGSYANVGTGGGGAPYGSLYLQTFDSTYTPYGTHSGPQAPPPIQSNNRISPGLPPTSAPALQLGGIMNSSSAPGKNSFNSIRNINPNPHPSMHHGNSQPFSQMTHHLPPHPHMAPIGPQKGPYSQQPLPQQTQPQLYIPFDPNQQTLMNLGQNYGGLRAGGGPPPSATPPMQGLSSSYYAPNPQTQGAYPQQNPQAAALQGMVPQPGPNPHFSLQFQQTNMQPYNSQGPAGNVPPSLNRPPLHGSRK